MPEFQTDFDPAYGRSIAVAPNICRVTAHNPSAFTFAGTNSYVFGLQTCCVVDPGPDDDTHLDALEAAIAGRPVEAILLTHTHRDHTGLVRRLAARSGAPVVGGGPHRASRELRAGEAEQLEAAGDTDLAFDRVLADSERLMLGGLAVTAIATPGHCANHLAFAVGGDGVLLSGDHVMGWSTTIVAPPDGAMRDYMASLDRLLQRDDRLYLPGHGGAIAAPKAFVRGLVSHRRMRETAIVRRLKDGDSTIPQIVAALYRTTHPRLHGAAGLSVLAHLEDLVARGLVTCEGPPSLRTVYTPA
jgi:glyoxylase-like metal-dependent hydrolase (beta-lactamase superfamily II)